jgi:polysaccharide deacetylase family protein (PEP-CTERM system associated)
MNAGKSSKPTILLTFDVEDWFQVENFKPYIPFSSWPSCELRVEENTHRILNLLDSHSVQLKTDNGQRATGNGPDEKVQATFFVLGWIAKRLPHLVKEIHSRGHEVASHGYRHNLCSDSSLRDLRKDLAESKRLIENIIGARVFGYRAPSFSISDSILKTIEACGYLYDSSFNSFGIHGRYGKAHLPQTGRNGIAAKVSDEFYELPLSNLKIDNGTLPWAGGAYFRFIPFPIFRRGVQAILKKQKAYVFYMHPWEIDPAQPKVSRASTISKCRHYTNLGKTASKLSSFIQAFKNYTFITCYQYLQLKTG